MVDMAKTAKTSVAKPTSQKTVKSSKQAASRKSTKDPKKVSTTKKRQSNKVDYYPNRMTLAVSVLAGTMLVLITLIAVLGIQ